VSLEWEVSSKSFHGMKAREILRRLVNVIDLVV
jgi:hypothetical protein